MVEALIDAIRDGPVLEERGEATLAGVEHRIDSLHVEIRLLLSRKARVWQVLRCSAAADRDRTQRGQITAELFICHRDLGHKYRRKLRIQNRMTNLGATPSQIFDVLRIDAGEKSRDFFIELCLMYKKTIGIGCYCKTRRHA